MTTLGSLAFLPLPSFELCWLEAVHTYQKISNILSFQTFCLGNWPVGSLRWASPRVSPLSRQYHTGSLRGKWLPFVCIGYPNGEHVGLGLCLSHSHKHTLSHTKALLFRPSWTLLGFITSALSPVNTSDLCSRLGAHWKEWVKARGRRVWLVRSEGVLLMLHRRALWSGKRLHWFSCQTGEICGTFGNIWSGSKNSLLFDTLFVVSVIFRLCSHIRKKANLCLVHLF